MIKEYTDKPSLAYHVKQIASNELVIETYSLKAFKLMLSFKVQITNGTDMNHYTM